MPAKRSGSSFIIHASKADGAETCGACPVSVSAFAGRSVSSQPRHHRFGPAVEREDAVAKGRPGLVQQVDAVAMGRGRHAKDVPGGGAADLQRLAHRLCRLAPEVVHVALDPAGRGHDLGKVPACHPKGPPRKVEDHRLGHGQPAVDG